MSRSLLLSSSLTLLFACTGGGENPSSEETTPTTDFDYTLPEVDTGWPADTGSTDTEDTGSTDTEDTEPTDTEDTETTDTEDTDATDTEDTDVEAANLLADFEAGAETFTGFGGTEGSAVTDPTDTGNTVGELVKSDAAETWGGVTISYCDNFGITELPFSETATSITAEVWSNDPGMTIRLKVENTGDATVSVETDATTAAKGAWETLTWDFSSEASGTAALDTANTYDKMSIFPNFGTTGADAGEITIYVDDFAFSDVDELGNECPATDTADTGSSGT